MRSLGRILLMLVLEKTILKMRGIYPYLYYIVCGSFILHQLDMYQRESQSSVVGNGKEESIQIPEKKDGAVNEGNVFIYGNEL